ncbi:ATP-dependent RNA helicase DHX29 (DEAH box protein 29) (Nucleic acid helicase DDXx) [Durusdinium trenchii]|uniref:ATP-dependent RNA helicase DHX29 (DEAH box protein 29) (Nucleic acid helicase DDXx) n=1 Tax=Durusdinium trenchii TaxID=1381693 RepID=A0ABP0IZQ0_9DINO
MAKRKKKVKNVRAYATTRQPSKADELGIKGLKELALEGVSTKASPATGSRAVKGDADTNSGAARVDDNKGLAQGDKAQGGTFAPKVPKEFEAVFAGRRKLLRASLISGTASKLSTDNAASLQLDARQERRVAELLLPQAEQHTEPPKRMTDLQLKTKLLQCVLELEELGFEAEQIKASLRVCGPYVVDCIDWLSLTLPDTKLPRGWATIPTPSGEESTLEVVVRAPAAPTKPEKKKTPTKQEQIKQSSLPPPSPSAALAPSKKTKGRDKTAKQSEKRPKNAEAAVDKDQIMRMVAMQMQEEEEEEARQAATDAGPPKDPWADFPPEEQIPAITMQIKTLSKKASKPGADKREIGLEIKRIKADLTKLEKKHPEAAKSFRDQEEREREAMAILQQEQRHKEEVDEDTEQSATPKGNEETAKTGEAEGGEDDDEDDDVGSLFSALFVEDEDCDDASASATTNRKLVDLSEAAEPRQTKQSPSALLQTHVKRVYGKNVKIHYDATSLSTFVHTCTIRFADVVKRMPDDEYCGSAKEAQMYVALIALYSIASDMSYHQRMAPDCQALWLEWQRSAKRATEQADLDTKMGKLNIVEQVLGDASRANQARLSSATSTKTQRLADRQQQQVVEQAKEEALTNGEIETRDRLLEQEVQEAEAAALETRRATAQYQSFERDRAVLPVMAIRDELVRTMDEHNVVIVSGTTGSGKTTQCPRILLEHEIFSRRGKQCSIACCEPRRISAVSVAERVAEEMNDPGLGHAMSYVGYQIRGERKTGTGCRLMYCTTGILLATLKSDPLLRSYSHIVVDEVHERTVDSDFLLVVLRRVVKERSGTSTPLKVVLMSATIDLDKLSGYFDGAPILEAGGRTFPVTKFPLEDCVELTGYVCEIESEYCRRELSFNSRKSARTVQYDKATVTYQQDTAIDYEAETGLDASLFSEATLQTVYRVDETRVNLDLIENLLARLVELNVLGGNGAPGLKADDQSAGVRSKLGKAVSLLSNDGDSHANAVLVFLPGMYHIQALFDRLSHHRLFGNDRRFQVLRLHSSLSSLKEEQHMVFKIPPRGVTKIVLSTNIAETGVTIPDVVFVIDTCRVKQTGYQPGRQMQSLEETFVSQASVTQRAGRAGRVRPGMAFQLVSSSTQASKMLDFQVPEIRRVALESVCLQILAMGENPTAFLADALDPPNDKAVVGAIKNLVDAGAVVMPETETSTTSSNAPETTFAPDTCPDLTALGQHLSHFPLDIKIGKMLIYACIFRCLDPVLTVAASIGLEQKVFTSPASRQAEAAQAQKRFLHDASDLLTLHNVFDAWRASGFASSFCRKAYLSYRSMQEIRKTRKDLFGVLQRTGFVRHADFDALDKGGKDSPLLNAHGSNDSLLCSILCSGLYPNLARVVCKPHGQPTYFSRTPGSNHEEVVFLVKKSVNAGCSAPPWLSINTAHDTWVTFVTKLKTGPRVMLYDSTFVPELALVLFGGQVDVYYQSRCIVVDRQIVLQATPKVAVMLKRLRRALNDQLQAHFDKPHSKHQKDLGLSSAAPSPLIDAIADLLMIKR